MDKKIKYITIEEFVEKGYLQECNRLFFHPCGLALCVSIDNTSGKYYLEGFWDYRDDDEGVIFDLENSKNDRIERFKKNEKYIADEFLRFGEKRREMFKGSNIESIPLKVKK